MNKILLIMLCLTSSLFAKGRIDIGPALVNVDMLESGKTVRSLDLFALKGDATLMVYEGLCIKPSFLFADGKANLNSASIGLGYCIPLTDCITVTPSYGVTGTLFKSRLDIPQYGMYHVREKFRSQGQYVCLDATWTFLPGWRIYGVAQYAWSHVHTKVGPFKTKNNTEGPSYALALERDINDEFSITLGAGYNASLSKEKHGLRGKGIKLGLAYWY